MATLRLTDLLPTNGYLLPYALSLFFASLLLTFAGAFLTLDRTRSFAPAGDVFQNRQKSTFRLIAPFFRGGVGGILTGFVFGIHFTTFLSLLIPSVTPSQPLKPAPYVSVWLLSSLVTSIAAGRWKYFALVASGICGGASLALAVSVTIHPSLLTRIVLVGVFTSTFAVLIPLPISRLQSILLRTSSSAAGAFGLIISIALFSRIEPWSNVWERLWLRNDIQWGSAQEKGLSAGFFLFLASGVSADWWLRREFGENPDQKWDSYLAEYVANLPTGSNRAGAFHPLASIWSKPLFKCPGVEPDTPSEASQEKGANLLYKTGKDKWMGIDRAQKKTRGNIKFRPLDDEDSTDSETEVERLSGGDVPHVNFYPWLAGAGSAASTYSSTATVLGNGAHSQVDSKKDPHQPNLEGTDSPDYSDHEADITSGVKLVGHDPDWTPRFLQNREQLPQTDDLDITPPLDEAACGAGQRGSLQKNQRDSPKRHENPRWQTFWRDVNERIQHKEI